MHTEESYEEEIYGEVISDEVKQQERSERKQAEKAIHEVEEHEAADLFEDLSTEHPHTTDIDDQSGKFRSLMEQIDTAQTEQERVKHYHDALHIFTNNWLGKQGLKIGEVAIMMGGMMAGLGALATKAIKSMFVIGIVVYLDHQLPKEHRMGVWDKARIMGLSTLSTAVVGWIPTIAADQVGEGVDFLLTPITAGTDILENAIEYIPNHTWLPDLDLGWSTGVSSTVQGFVDSISGTLGFVGAGAAEWFFNSTGAILNIFYNHLAHEREEVLVKLQQLQQEASTENQEEVQHLKQDVHMLQTAMTQVLDEKKM